MIEAEQAVLGSIFFEPKLINEVSAALKPEDFFEVRHRIIFEAMISVHDKHSGTTDIDELLVGEKLQSNGLLGEIGGLGYLGDLIGFSPAVDNIKRYMQIVAENATLRKYEEIKKAPDSGKDVDLKIQATIDELTKLRENLYAETGFSSVQDVSNRLIAQMEKIEPNSGYTGYATGLRDLDEATLGMQKSDLIILGARSGHGKTALALQMMHGVAESEAGKTQSLMFTLEMSNEQCLMRMLSAKAKISTQNMKSGSMSQDDWDRLALKMNDISKLSIGFNDSVESMEQLYSFCVKAQLEKPVNMVVIDYLGLLKVGQKAWSKEDGIAEITRQCKRLAKFLDCPVVLLAQVLRSVDDKADKRPMVSDLKGSGAIEADADIVLLLYRDEMYNKDTPDQGIAELNIAKFRNGEPRTLRLRFRGKYTQFGNCIE